MRIASEIWGEEVGLRAYTYISNNENDAGNAFQDAIKRLVWHGYNQQDYNTAVYLYLDCCSKGALYKQLNYTTETPKTNPIVKQLNILPVSDKAMDYIIEKYK